MAPDKRYASSRVQGVQVKRNQVHELEKLMWIELVKVRMYIQANLCQKLLFRHQLPKLQYDKRLFIMKLRVQYMEITSSEHLVYLNCSECRNKNKKQFMYTTCSEHVIFIYWTRNSMNNLLSIVGKLVQE